MTNDEGRRTPLADRAVGVLLGGACGDALGVPYEFATASLGPDETPRMIGGGLGPYAPAEWSDDTQMAMVIAQVAAEHDLQSPVALDLIAEGWIAWLRSGATDVGNQTRRVLTVADSQQGPAAQRTRTAALQLHAETGRTAGNGSLMRTGPVALAFLDDPVGLAAAARSISDLTHPDPVAGDACVLWSEATRRAVVDGEPVDMSSVLSTLPAERREMWQRWLSDAQSKPPSSFNPNGYAPVALQAAWSAVCHPWPDDSTNALSASLFSAVHAGDDTDTVAAIAGAYLGGLWGASSIPAEWSGVHGWPGLNAADLRRIALKIARVE